jgi:hypothetical protein
LIVGTVGTGTMTISNTVNNNEDGDLNEVELMVDKPVIDMDEMEYVEEGLSQSEAPKVQAADPANRASTSIQGMRLQGMLRRPSNRSSILDKHCDPFEKRGSKALTWRNVNMIVVRTSCASNGIYDL